MRKEIIEKCRHGDRTAQIELYKVLAPKMFALCIRYMENRDDAEDILQEGFVTLFSRIGDFAESGSFEGWARRIFVNTALMSLRKKNALKMSDSIDSALNISSKEPNPVHNIEYKEILRLIASLPTGYRTAFNMFAVEGYSHSEIADALGISPATSRSQVMRARAILQEKLRLMNND